MKSRRMLVALVVAVFQASAWAVEPAAPSVSENDSPDQIPGAAQLATKPGAPSTAEPQDQINARVKTWQELRFGMFIHWGVYSQLAGELNGKPIRAGGEWIQYHANIPNDEYVKLAASFNPVKFNAEEWVQIAKDAGMKYIVITSKHHDGFCLFPSQYSDFTMQKATPFKRDPLKELADACRKAGLGFGLYYSNDLDWHHNMWNNNAGEDLRKNNRYVEPFPGKAMGPNLAKQDPKNFDNYYRNVAMPQVRELLSNYGPLMVLFFDGHPKASNVEQGLAMRLMVRQLQPNVAINNRLRSVPGDFFSREQHVPTQPDDTKAWEACITMNTTWGYKKADTNYKSSAELVFTLVDACSKGGNFLLNVGPTGEGLIPEESVTRLKDVGAWLKVNGEAIYGAQRTAFGTELGEFDPVKKRGNGQPKFNVAKAWRCTTKPGKLYIHLFKWPGEKFELNDVKGRVTKAYLLADSEKALTLAQEAGKVILTLPAKAPDKIASVLCLEVEGGR